jgi:hypothetical protein
VSSRVFASGRLRQSRTSAGLCSDSEEKLAIKERALQKLAPAGKPITRFKADDALLTFFASL